MLPRILAALSLLVFIPHATAAERWPTLPDADGAVEIPAQEWPLRPGARTVRVLVHYPGGKLSNVTKRTGVMLTLHNWGGTDCVGTADPRELAKRLDVVALCVNYLQSGRKDSIDGPEPYDFGYLQALDSLRALYFVTQGLTEAKKPFDGGRLYATGGSGGGNVTLMTNKLAPRTFACVIDLCGMAKLSDDIAFDLPGGSSLNARYSREPKSPNYLSLDHQELRFVGNPDHLDVMKRLGSTAKVIVVHGTDDTTCPHADAVEMVGWMKRARLDVEPRFIGKQDLDGKVFTSAGHALGHRTEIVFRVAGAYLDPDSKTVLRRAGKSDFDHRDEVRYPTSGGAFVISYRDGYPVGRFEPASKPVDYPDPADLLHFRDDKGQKQPVKSVADWQTRRRHARQNLERVMGPLPSPLKRVPLDVKVVEEKRVGELIRKKLTYQSDPTDRVSAYLFVPATKPAKPLPAVLCLHQTTRTGKDEPAGLGNADLAYALHLAQRGYVTLAPDYPSMGEHRYDFDAKHGYVSGSMKAVWDNVRAVDLLETLAEVDAERIGVIGHSLGGHNAMFTAVFDPRLKVIVSSCGFTTFRKDDMPSWTGRTYMPRIKDVYGNDAKKVPFDFHEIVASFAPRPFLASAAEQDDDFGVSGVREVMASAKAVYQLHDAAARLVGIYPKAKHSFPVEARKSAYEFLDYHLKGTDKDDLAGHWRLAGDASDSSGQRLHASNHGVKFAAKAPDGKTPAASFDGKGSHLSVKPGFRLGKGDFTVALWVHTERILDNDIGDLVTLYDAKKRIGFNLSLRTNTGVTSCQANTRQLAFGIDAGSEPKWTDEGRPSKAILAFGLAVHDGHLYAGTASNAKDEVGRVFRYDGPGKWIDCGAPDRCNAISALAVHEGKLYAASAKYRFAGSSLEESKNDAVGGGIFRYEGGTKWKEVGRLRDTEAVGGLVVFAGRLYASSLYKPAGFFRYESDGKWTALAVPDGKRVESLGVFDGHLWATSYDGGRVYRYSGDKWKDFGQLGDNTQTYSFAIHRGRLCVGTWPSGKVYRLDGQTWTDLGRLGKELEVMGMLVHNGQLYAGTLPLAEVYRYDGEQTWTRTAQLDRTPDVRYRRAWTMAQYQGRLFCSTLPSGHVHSLEAGPCITHDRELPAGWRHIAAVKEGGVLKLYVDGKRVAESKRFDVEKFDLDTDAPLLLGAGQGAAFRGTMSEVRLARRAYTEAEITRLAKPR